MCHLDSSADTPVRVKRVIVEFYQMTLRWQEEIEVVKEEMACLLKFYVDRSLPRIDKTYLGVGRSWYYALAWLTLVLGFCLYLNNIWQSLF